MDKEDRYRLYLQYKAQKNPPGARMLAKLTGIPLGTVKSDLHRLRINATRNPPVVQSPSEKQYHNTSAPHRDNETLIDIAKEINRIGLEELREWVKAFRAAGEKEKTIAAVMKGKSLLELAATLERTIQVITNIEQNIDARTQTVNINIQHIVDDIILAAIDYIQQDKIDEFRAEIERRLMYAGYKSALSLR